MTINIKLKSIFFICFLASLLCGMYGCKYRKADKVEKPIVSLKEQSIAEVEVQLLNKSTFNQEIISNGKLFAANKATLRFEIAGTITSIRVKNGDFVSKGQKIAELDKQELLVNLQKSKANVDRLKLELQDVLIGQGYKLSDSASIPTHVLQLAQTRSGYDQAKLDYLSTHNMLRKATLVAPISGTIANLNTKPFNTPSGDLCIVVDNRQLEVEFTVMESELLLLKKGEPIAVSLFALEGKTATGYITEINPLVDINGLVNVKAKITNSRNKFFEGMSVRVKIRKSIPEQWVVNKRAVVLRDGKQVVFTVKDNRAYWNYVKIGSENSDYYTIESGLSNGDSVIIDGNLHLAHDTPIKIKK